MGSRPEWVWLHQPWLTLGCSSGRGERTLGGMGPGTHPDFQTRQSRTWMGRLGRP